MEFAINAAVIRNNKILLIRKGYSWILPGGKPEQGETDHQCLQRKVKEKQPEVNLQIFNYYSNFQGVTPQAEDVLEARVYFASMSGDVTRISRELVEARWFQKDELPRRLSDVTHSDMPLSDITQKIVDSLLKDGYL